MFNRKNRFIALTALWLVLGTALSSCGGQAYREGENDENTVGDVGDQASNNLPPVVVNPTDPGTGGGGTSYVPPVHYSFTVTGSATKTFAAVTTDNTLRVRVNAGAASGNLGTYGCVSYTISALGKTIQTATLSSNGSNGFCPNAPSSEIVDFSDRLGSGHLPVVVKIEAVRTDFYCQLYWSCWNNPYINGGCGSMLAAGSGSFCPLRALYQTHSATGSVDIEVSGSKL